MKRRGKLRATVKRPVVSIIRAADQLGQRLRWTRASVQLGSVGSGTKIANSVKIYAGRTVHIGARSVLNDYVHIWGAGGVTIGNDCLIAAHVVITSQSHDVNAAQRGQLYSSTIDNKQVTLGNNVWIGSNVTILPGISIGDGAVIGAGSVVSRDVPAYHLAMGVPARTVRPLK